jgi:proline iminopeptidase
VALAFSSQGRGLVFGMAFPEADRSGSLVDAYHRLLMNPDPAIHEKAARDWCEWEMALVAVRSDHKPHPRYEQSAFRLGFARLVTHYWHHNAWLEGDVLQRDANRLSGIPGVLIHGRLDLGSRLSHRGGSRSIGRAVS